MHHLYYVRTTEGQAAAYDATSAMPRKLKSLLKVIDGNTSLAVFTNSLKAFGDVQGLLTSLQTAGLIEMRDDTNLNLTPVKTTPSAPTPAGTGLASSLASKLGLRSDLVNDNANADGFAMTQTVHTQPQTTIEQRSSTGVDGQREQDLQLLVQDMSSFVLAYVPEQAFGVLSELEQVSDVEQMAVLLGGYELIVRHVGEPAKIHMLHVRQTLGKWL